MAHYIRNNELPEEEDKEPCKNIVRPKMIFEQDLELVEALNKSFDCLPLIESKLRDFNYRRYYSLHSNELLKCRWQQYKKNINNKMHEPYFFPTRSDQHFINCQIKFAPQLTTSRLNPRVYHKPGPGVDEFGQKPTPFEFHMSRGLPLKEDRKKSANRTEDSSKKPRQRKVK